MINSMTGYGCAGGEYEGVVYEVEIKTVNSRYFKARMRLPESIAFLEEHVDRLLRRNVLRGTIDCVLSLKNTSETAFFNLDEKTLSRYLEKLGRIAKQAGMEGQVDISGLLNLPGIVQAVVPEGEKAEEVKKKVLEVTEQAIVELKKMRACEGAALATDLQGNCDAIKNSLEKIRSRSGLVIEEYHDKLRTRVDELLADGMLKIDAATLSREIAVYADRADISEEIARLDSHLERFAEGCKGNGAAGRRLDFISQEMLREANTISSKASDTEIIHLVVDIKCCIDRIKEQAQNIE